MTKSESLQLNIKTAIRMIKSKTSEERQEVLEIFTHIKNEFYLLSRVDFTDDKSFDRYIKMKYLFDQTKALNFEVEYLSNLSNKEHISDNYFQTKACLLMIEIPLKKINFY